MQTLREEIGFTSEQLRFIEVMEQYSFDENGYEYSFWLNLHDRLGFAAFLVLIRLDYLTGREYSA